MLNTKWHQCQIVTNARIHIQFYMTRTSLSDPPVLDFGTGQISFEKDTNFKLPCDATGYPEPINVSIIYNSAVITEYDVCMRFSCDDVSGKCTYIVFVGCLGVYYGVYWSYIRFSEPWAFHQYCRIV